MDFLPVLDFSPVLAVLGIPLFFPRLRRCIVLPVLPVFPVFPIFPVFPHPTSILGFIGFPLGFHPASSCFPSRASWLSLH